MRIRHRLIRPFAAQMALEETQVRRRVPRVYETPRWHNPHYLCLHICRLEVTLKLITAVPSTSTAKYSFLCCLVQKTRPYTI